MKEELIINCHVTKYKNFEALPIPDQLIVKEAIAASERAYAPYSKFHVGAALEEISGKIITGNNQENAVYPTGICAERVALFSAFAANPDINISSLAVVASHKGNLVAAPPCGSCRQAILEMEKRQKSPIKIIFAIHKGVYVVANSVEDLLPLSFTSANLNEQHRD